MLLRTNDLYLIQYLVEPPFVLKKDKTLSVIDRFKLLSSFFEIKAHYLITSSLSSLLFLNCLPLAKTALAKLPHIFSIGFKSGLYAGHLIMSIFWFWSQLVVI